MDENRRTISEVGRTLGLVVALLGAMAAPGWAGPTDPTLLLSEALASQGSSRLVIVRGVFPGDDLLQVAYPLQLLVSSDVDGVSYVRYALAQGGFSGTDAALSDGLDPADVAGLIGAGTPAPEALIASIDVSSISVLLPSAFPAGPGRPVG